VQEAAAANPEKPKIEVQTRKKSDEPRAIGNAGGAKYLPGVPDK
jgi:hypothetical protein